MPRCTNQNFILMTPSPAPSQAKKKKKILATSQSPQIWKEIKHILMVVISVGGSLGGLF